MTDRIKSGIGDNVSDAIVGKDINSQHTTVNLGGELRTWDDVSRIVLGDAVLGIPKLRDVLNDIQHSVQQLERADEGHAVALLHMKESVDRMSRQMEMLIRILIGTAVAIGLIYTIYMLSRGDIF